MQSVQESKQELEASIRYAENAISSAKQTIESMEFRQEMAKNQYAEQTGREEALTKQVQELEERNDKLNIQIVEQTNREATLESRCTAFSRDLTAKGKECEQLQDQLNDFRASAFEDAKTIEQLNKAVQRQQDFGQGYYDDMMMYKEKADSLSATIQRLKEGQPTMPVIPKAVAIAIFREGMAYGAGGVCDELDGERINVSEEECVGSFSVTFECDIELDDHLDTDYLRSKAVDNCDDEWVVDCLKTLCADNKFECRIHGVDDQEENKND